jgi:hypothetical protein
MSQIDERRTETRRLRSIALIDDRRGGWPIISTSHRTHADSNRPKAALGRWMPQNTPLLLRPRNSEESP